MPTTYHRRPKVMPGMRFGRLVVVAEAPLPRRRHCRQMTCECDCGNTTTVTTVDLNVGKTQSCGCLQQEQRAVNGALNRRHGAAGNGKRWPEYNAWLAMLDRCHNPRCKAFKDYGARGIAVCDRWRFGEEGQTAFQCFIADMGRKPQASLSLGRLNNNGGYTPTNCAWQTGKEQQRNRRVSLVYKIHTVIPLENYG